MDDKFSIENLKKYGPQEARSLLFAICAPDAYARRKRERDRVRMESLPHHLREMLYDFRLQQSTPLQRLVRRAVSILVRDVLFERLTHDSCR